MFMILRITPDTGSENIIKLPHFFRNPICHIIPGLGPHMNIPVFHALIQSEIQINACFHKPPGKSQVIIEQEITGSDQDHGRRHSVHLRVKDRGYVRLPDQCLPFFLRKDPVSDTIQVIASRLRIKFHTGIAEDLPDDVFIFPVSLSWMPRDKAIYPPAESPASAAITLPPTA